MSTRSVVSALDIDEDTLRDTDEIFPVNDRKKDKKAKPGGEPMPGAEGSQLLKANAGMMRLPATIDRGRRSTADLPPNTSANAEEPKSARNTWKAPPTGDSARSIAKGQGQAISLSDTAISAMPSTSRDLVVLYDRDGAFASSVRILATRVEELKSRLGFKSFLVTSVGDGDGKSVLANNLALAMSEDADRRVALVDANFRSPRAAELFNLDLDRGLLAALSGNRPLAQCVARVIGRNLIVLHAGGEHKNPASVLASSKFKGLLAELYQAVDYMIVDAPSAIPYADVPLIAQHVDAVLMVVTADRTRRMKLDQAMDTIGRSRIHGQIFVDFGGHSSKLKKIQ